MTNDKAIELIKDEYCADCVEKSEDHCEPCVIDDILKLLAPANEEE